MLENKQIIIAGGGHAGIEAALAIQKRGYSCIMVTMNKDAIGRLSCNPAIGGLAKGHLVREIDALGGIMGLLADDTTLQHKILNKSRDGDHLWWISDMNKFKRHYPKWKQEYDIKKIIKEMYEYLL